MIRRFAIASLLTVASAAALAPNAFAQTEASTVTLTAENAAKCILTNGNSSITTNVTSAGLATQLTGNGNVNVRCNKSGASGTVLTQPASSVATTNTLTSPSVNIPASGVSTPVPFNFIATSTTGGVLPAGNYAYDVVVTVTY